MTFHVISHEGSVIVLCATSIELGLIHPHSNLDEVPEEGSLIYSIDDMSKKQKNKKCQAESIRGPVKPKKDMQSEKPAMKSRYKKSIGSNKNCKATICENSDSKSQDSRSYDKNCQDDKNSFMWSVTKEENTDVQLPKPARLFSDKNCQSTRCYKNMSPRRPMYDK